MVYYVFGLSVTSFVLAILLALSLLKIRRIKKAPVVTHTKDAHKLMSDLMNGGAITVMKIIDPDSMMLKSPRD
jgi:hypothetical protein